MGDLRVMLQNRPFPIDPPPQFVCPACWWASWHPGDRREGYCGNCRAFTGVPDRGAPVRTTTSRAPAEEV
jgi:hypothetical protein